MFFPDRSRSEMSEKATDLLSAKANFGRGRSLAAAFKNKFTSHDSILSMENIKQRIRDINDDEDRRSNACDTVKSDDEIIVCGKSRQDDEDEDEKTFAVFQCWPTVNDPMPKCWDKPKLKARIKEIKDDGEVDVSSSDKDSSSEYNPGSFKPAKEDRDQEYFVEYAPLVVGSYPKARIAVEVPHNYNFPQNSAGKMCVYESVPYPLSVSAKYLPRKYVNKLNPNNRNRGGLAYKFDTCYDPDLAGNRRYDANKYAHLHRKINAPYNRKINYWKKDKGRDIKNLTEDEVKDPVSALYIWCSRNKAIPTFTFTNEVEYDCETMIGLVFLCKITLYEHETVGKGVNKKESKRLAAEKMLSIINSGFQKKSEKKKKKEDDDVVEEKQEKDNDEDKEDDEEDGDEEKEKPKKNKEITTAEEKKIVSVVKNPISVLHELAARLKWSLPDYEIHTFGSIFKCRVTIIMKGEIVEDTGFGHTKKEAKFKAASNMLKLCSDKNILPKAVEAIDDAKKDKKVKIRSKSAEKKKKEKEGKVEEEDKEDNPEAGKEEDEAEASKENKAEARKESKAEASKESKAEASKESKAEAGKESKAEAGKESKAEAGKKSYAEASKEGKIDDKILAERNVLRAALKHFLLTECD